MCKGQRAASVNVDDWWEEGLELELGELCFRRRQGGARVVTTGAACAGVTQHEAGKRGLSVLGRRGTDTSRPTVIIISHSLLTEAHTHSLQSTTTTTTTN